MKGKEKEYQGKWSGSEREARRNAKKQRIRDAFNRENDVEVIPAIYDLTPDEPKILRVAAYCRVSTDQESQADSYETQVQYYTQYIQRNPEWEYVGTYADEGRSGTNVVKRQHFLEMIADCKAGKIDLIITKDIRRFARNTLDCISYVRQLKHLDPPVGVLFEDEHLNTLDRGNEAILALLSSVAQGESENKSEAIKWSYRRRFANGIALCPTWALLGYTTDEFGNMVVVPSEAEIVRFIYESYLEGWSTKEIAAKLTAAEIPTVKGLSVWPAGSVYSILRNEKYCGDVMMQKTYTPDFLTHRAVKNIGQERKYYKRDHHEAIVSRSDWEKVQKQLVARRHQRGHARREREIEHITIPVVKRGVFKGYVVFDPKWTGKDLPKVMSRMGITQKEKE
jgi:site-specific DNA recombinase